MCVFLASGSVRVVGVGDREVGNRRSQQVGLAEPCIAVNEHRLGWARGALCEVGKVGNVGNVVKVGNGVGEGRGMENAAQGPVLRNPLAPHSPSSRRRMIARDTK